MVLKPSFCREEATRTPDPYVPNVVRYQLRYFSKCRAFLDYFAEAKFSRSTRFPSKAGAKVLLFSGIRKFFCNYFALFRLKVRFPGTIGAVLAIISFTSDSFKAAISVPLAI